MERQCSSSDGSTSVKVIGKTVSVAQLGWWRLCAGQAAGQAWRTTGFHGRDANRILCCKVRTSANVCKPWGPGWEVRVRPGCWHRLGGQPGDHVRHQVRHRRRHSGAWCVLWGHGGRVGPCGEEAGSGGSICGRKSGKSQHVPLLLPARLLLRCGLTRRPSTTLGAHESLRLSRLLAGRPRPPRGLWRPPQLRHQRKVVSGRHLKPRAFCWAETGETVLLSWQEVHVPSSQGLCGRGLWGGCGRPGLACSVRTPRSAFCRAFSRNSRALTLPPQS